MHERTNSFNKLFFVDSPPNFNNRAPLDHCDSCVDSKLRIQPSNELIRTFNAVRLKAESECAQIWSTFHFRGNPVDCRPAMLVDTLRPIIHEDDGEVYRFKIVQDSRLEPIQLGVHQRSKVRQEWINAAFQPAHQTTFSGMRVRCIPELIVTNPKTRIRKKSSFPKSVLFLFYGMCAGESGVSIPLMNVEASIADDHRFD